MATDKSDVIKGEFFDALEAFKASAGLSAEELRGFQLSSLTDLQTSIGIIQHEQSRTRTRRYMKRLEPFLKTVEEYGKVIEVFVNSSEMLAFVWVAAKSLFQRVSC